jgi:hypothetical protein
MFLLYETMLVMQSRMRPTASGKCCLAGTVQAAHPLQLMTYLLASCKQVLLLNTENAQQQHLLQQCPMMRFREQCHRQQG